MRPPTAIGRSGGRGPRRPFALETGRSCGYVQGRAGRATLAIRVELARISKVPIAILAMLDIRNSPCQRYERLLNHGWVRKTITRCRGGLEKKNSGSPAGRKY